MKKVKFLLAFLLLTAATFAQIKPPSGKAKPSKPGNTTPVTQQNEKPQVIKDSMTVSLLKRTDTLKVRLVLYVEDHSLYWENGYLIRTIVKVGDAEEKQSGNSYYFDDKFLPLKDTDIFYILPAKW